MSVLDALLTRRSVKVKQLTQPGPSESQIRTIMMAAMRVPDHGKLCPWSITLLDKAGQAALGELLAARFAQIHPEANEKQIEFERQQPQRAPLLAVVLHTPVIGRIPNWEQELSTGAVCMNLLHAAHALGFAGQWLTEWPAYDAKVKEALGGTLEDKIAGFIYIGTPTEKPDERARPDYNDVVQWWDG